MIRKYRQLEALLVGLLQGWGPMEHIDRRIMYGKPCRVFVTMGSQCYTVEVV